jgi:hypothetical protein
MKHAFRLGAFVLALAAGNLWAQTTAGSGTVIVIPIAAETASFTTEVLVRNASGTAMTLNVLFYEARTSAVPGLRPCNDFALAASQNLPLTVAGQCTLGPGSHHGMLILQDAAVEKTHLFYAYSRSQTPAGAGFSVEGYPAGNFSSQSASVLGLKRTATGAKYLSNCFVGALGETVDYRLTLLRGTDNAQIGVPITGTLQPHEMIRHFDVFTAAGAPAGDYDNVRALFEVTTSTGPALVGFCTVQESVTFGADFRIAKSREAQDQRQRRLTCYSSDDCVNANTVAPTQITDAGRKSIHYFLIAQPDYVKCDLVSDRLADLEMQLRGPGDVFAAPVFATAAPYSSGGNGKTSFYVFTGNRAAIADGVATRWFIDVSFREGGNATMPINYGIVCHSGNGVSVPWYRTSDVDNF